jgi:uncharacterized LabA/DUF88 family protein
MAYSIGKSAFAASEKSIGIFIDHDNLNFSFREWLYIALKSHGKTDDEAREIRDSLNQPSDRDKSEKINYFLGKEVRDDQNYKVPYIQRRVKEGCRGDLKFTKVYYPKPKEDDYKARLDYPFRGPYEPLEKVETFGNSDPHIICDIMEELFSKKRINTYVIATGDSDFAEPCIRLKKENKQVVVIGVRHTMKDKYELRLIDEKIDFMPYDGREGLHCKYSSILHERLKQV